MELLVLSQVYNQRLESRGFIAIISCSDKFVYQTLKSVGWQEPRVSLTIRDRGATLRLGDTISDSILGGTKHFFLLTLYNFNNIGRGGGGGARAPLPPNCSVPDYGLRCLKYNLSWYNFGLQRIMCKPRNYNNYTQHCAQLFKFSCTARKYYFSNFARPLLRTMISGIWTRVF